MRKIDYITVYTNEAHICGNTSYLNLGGRGLDLFLGEASKWTKSGERINFDVDAVDDYRTRLGEIIFRLT